MGQNFSTEPVVDKETERDHNDTFNVAVSSCQGWRMSQEDNHSMMLELPGEHNAAFFAVYDGHGSARVSKHASEALWRHIIENDMYQKGNFEEALEQSFLTFDKEVDESYNAQLAGTTAVCLLIVNNKIYCANIGDSRAVASVNCECIPMSYDHKPENPQELKRIVAAGGYVVGNRVNGNLALSRAFGDFHYKGHAGLEPEHQVVSPCPDIKTLDLNDDVDFLVLACDGIWDVLSSEEVVEFVISRLEESMEPGLICEQLTTRCLATDYELVIGCDNMTVLLVCYTRGRSWEDYCTDIFNKNTQRLGKPRIRPSGEQEGERTAPISSLSVEPKTVDAPVEGEIEKTITAKTSSPEEVTLTATAIAAGILDEAAKKNISLKGGHNEESDSDTISTKLETKTESEAEGKDGGDQLPSTIEANGSEKGISGANNGQTQEQTPEAETVTETVSEITSEMATEVTDPQPESQLTSSEPTSGRENENISSAVGESSSET